jgi:hypothetical protein
MLDPQAHLVCLTVYKRIAGEVCGGWRGDDPWKFQDTKRGCRGQAPPLFASSRRDDLD